MDRGSALCFRFSFSPFPSLLSLPVLHPAAQGWPRRGASRGADTAKESQIERSRDQSARDGAPGVQGAPAAVTSAARPLRPAPPQHGDIRTPRQPAWRMWPVLLSPATKLGLREPPGSSHGHWEAVPLLDPATESTALTPTLGFLLASRRRSSLYDRLRGRLLANRDQSSFPKTAPTRRAPCPGLTP